MAYPADLVGGETISAALLNSYNTAMKTGGNGASYSGVVSGTVTINEPSCKVTSESLTTAAGSTYTLLIYNTKITTATLCFANVYLGTSTTGTPQVVSVTPTASEVRIVVKNIHASAAFNGTLIIDFFGLSTA